MLKSTYYIDKVEAGCDEAGRGCLAGSVFAAAVILPPDYENELLNDSKQLSEKKRYLLRSMIEKDALAWAVGVVTAEEIDRINILNASILAMHRALDMLCIRPETIIIDGNRFKPYHDIPYTTIVKEFPQYDWKSNKGYPTPKHRTAIKEYGISPYHRKSFTLLPTEEQSLDFNL